MQQSPQTLIHGGRRLNLPPILRQRWRWVALCATVLLVSLISLTAFTIRRQPQELVTATLQVDSAPTGATVLVDGHGRGETPLVLPLSERPHEIVLQRPGSADAVYEITPRAGVTTTLQADLWRRLPQLDRLRPPLPGAAIQHADFLADGGVVLILSLPPGEERQAWLLGNGQTERVGPTTIQGSLAVSPDGLHVAYLARSDATGPTPRLDEVWVAPAREGRGERRYRLPTVSGDEALVDLSWSGDGEGLLLASRQRLSGGGARTHIRWLPVGSTEARDLVSLPSDLVPGSFLWSPSGEVVAFLTQSGSQTALCLLEIDTDHLRYLADVQDGDSHPFPVPPIAWSPDGQRFLYTAPAQGRSGQGGWLLGGKSQPSLFLASPDDSAGRRVADAEARFPVWRPDGGLVAFASSKRGLVLRAFTPSGTARDVGDIPLDATAYAVRWDPAHAQAIVAVRSRGSWSSDQAEYWLARWQPEEAR